MKKTVIFLVVPLLTALVCCACKTFEEKPMEAVKVSDHAKVAAVIELSSGIRDRKPNFSDYHTLAINGYLLGGYYHDQWIPWEELYSIIPDEDIYKLYADGKFQGIGAGRKEPEHQEEVYGGPWVDFPNREWESDEDHVIVAYSGVEDLQIESGTLIAPDNEIYINILQEYLLKTGLQDDFELTNIVKIDLEGDGQDEVFIQAYHYEEEIHKSIGIQYMRKIVNGEAEEFAIPLTMPTVSADHLEFIGFCDINHDGSKEVLVSAMGIGYHSYMVYEFKNQEFIRIFENGGVH